MNESYGSVFLWLVYLSPQVPPGVAHKVPTPLDYTAVPWLFLSDMAVNVKSQMIMIFISFFIYAQKWDYWIIRILFFVNVAPPGQACPVDYSAIWLLVSRKWK